MKTTKKSGRKRKDFINPKTGKPVVGLTRRPDGRWRIIGTHQTFREDDPQKAIEKYIALTSDIPQAIRDDLAKISFDGSAVSDLMNGFTYVGGVLGGMTPEQRHWRYVAKIITQKPQWVAEMTGIEKLGYLTDLKPPESLPTFKELEDIWEKFYKATEQKRRIMDAWRDFKATTKIDNLRDITPELCISFRDNVYARNLAPKSESNMFTRLRRLFTFVKSREVAPDSMAKIIDALKRLTPSDSTVSLDPNPISNDDLTALIKAADDEGKALIYLMLNGAFSIAEVIRLKWSEIKGETIVTHRFKSGKCIRVCVLWRETLDALEKVQRRGEFIFVSREGLKLSTSGADKRFRKIRTDAGLGKEVTSSHLRDGALTAAAAANVNSDICNLLAGHRSGIKDHYVKRNPKMVKPACDAVYDSYFGSR